MFEYIKCKTVFFEPIDAIVRLKKYSIPFFLNFCLAGGLSVCLGGPVSAQDTTPAAQPSVAEPQTSQDPSQQPAAALSSEKKPEEKTEPTEEKKDDKEKKHHRGALVIALLPIVSPAIGSGIIPVAGYIFPFQEKDKVSPPSVVGAAGLITNNDSRGFALGGDLYMKENRYELKAAFFMAISTTTSTVSVTRAEVPASNCLWSRPEKRSLLNSCAILAGRFSSVAASSLAIRSLL